MSRFNLVAEFNARGMERDGLRAKCATLERHIAELKDECDRLTTVIIETQDRCDAILAKTIEECVVVLGLYGRRADPDGDIAARLRALAHTDKK